MDLPSGFPDESYPGFAAPVVVKSHQTVRVACGLAKCVFHLKAAKQSDRNTAIYNDALPATDFDAKTATYSEQNPPARRVSKRGIGVRIRPRRVGVSPAASASTLPSTRSADYR